MNRRLVGVFLAFLGFWLLLGPVYAQKSPTLSIATPQDESIGSSKIPLEFSVTDFVLDPKPSEDEHHGVIALYLDGKFYTNTATSSATVQLARLGTHRIDAELVSASRQVLLPRVTDSVYLHNQKKTPHVLVSNLRNGVTIYTAQPTLAIELRKEQYEDQNTYFQVFVNGVVDGDSSQLEDQAAYVLKQSLKTGRNTIRVALYAENGKPYSPVVDNVVELFYEEATPVISSIDIATDETKGEIAFSSKINEFSIPKDGFLMVRDGKKETRFASTSGVLRTSTPGSAQLEFRLIDLYGFDILPQVSARKVVEPSLLPSDVTVSKVPQGQFYISENTSSVRWGFLVLSVLLAAVTLVFGGVLANRHSRYH